jgi:hypothetical protein
MDYKITETLFDFSFAEGFSPDSRVWIYHSDRVLNTTETDQLDQEILTFCKEWASHGSMLRATGKVLLNRILVLMVDESMAGASGCSIDSSVAFVKNIAIKYNIDLFDRMLITYLDGDTPHTTKLNDLAGELVGKQVEVLVFDNLVKNKKDLIEAGLVPVSQSWVARFL